MAETNGNGVVKFKGMAQTIANLGASAFVCMVLWYTLAEWGPGLAASLREEGRHDREASRQEMKEFRAAQERQTDRLAAALDRNTLAVQELHREMSLWKRGK